MRREVEALIKAGVTTQEEIEKAARYSFGVKYVAMGPVSSRGGVDRANQYEQKWLDEMDRRALDMLTIARAARNLEDRPREGNG